jgi:hypothetical protein
MNNPADPPRTKFKCSLTPATLEWIKIQSKHLDLEPGRVIELMVRLAMESQRETAMRQQGIPVQG